MFTNRLFEVWQSRYGDVDVLTEVFPIHLHPKEDGPAAYEVGAREVLSRYREAFGEVADAAGRRFPEFADWLTTEAEPWLDRLVQGIQVNTIEKLAELVALVLTALAILPQDGSEDDGWSWCMASFYTLTSCLPAASQEVS